MKEEQRLRIKCNQYAKRLVLLGEDDVVWEADPKLQNTSSNSDYAKCPICDSTNIYIIGKRCSNCHCEF